MINGYKKSYVGDYRVVVNKGGLLFLWFVSPAPYCNGPHFIGYLSESKGAHRYIEHEKWYACYYREPPIIDLDGDDEDCI